MRRGRIIGFIVVLFAVFFISVLSAHATLQNRGTDINGNRLIYDSDRNITWYDYSVFGNWQTMMNWASTLTVNFGETIYDDWRLPAAKNQDGTGPCRDYNCTGSEMGHLYYTELGNKAGSTGNGLINTGDFQNLKKDLYWLDMDPWLFTNHVGAQFTNYRGPNTYYALAVRNGDVASPVAPEPISSILFITGGSLLAGRRFIRRKA